MKMNGKSNSCYSNEIPCRKFTNINTLHNPVNALSKIKTYPSTSKHGYAWDAEMVRFWRRWPSLMPRPKSLRGGGGGARPSNVCYFLLLECSNWPVTGQRTSAWSGRPGRRPSRNTAPLPAGWGAMDTTPVPSSGPVTGTGHPPVGEVEMGAILLPEIPEPRTSEI